MQKVCNALHDEIVKYNWLITDCICYPENKKIEEQLNHEYTWLTGQELIDMVETENFQWIWAVLSGFTPDISLEEVLKEPLPYADGYEGFWKNPLSLQHTLSCVEIVPWDSSLLLLISKEKTHIEKFTSAFPLSKDLSEYNNE